MITELKIAQFIPLPSPLKTSGQLYTGIHRINESTQASEYLVLDMPNSGRMGVEQEAWGNRVYMSVQSYWVEHYSHTLGWGRFFPANIATLPIDQLTLLRSTLGSGREFLGCAGSFVIFSLFNSIGD